MPFDARRLDAAWDRYVAAIEAGYPAFRMRFGPGASADEIDSAEREIGVSLPADLRHLLGRLSGEAGCFVLPGWELFSPARIVEEWGVWEVLRRTQFVPEGYTCEPAGPIRGDEWWRTGWIPFCGDGGGDHLCVDLDPADGGRSGQVISMWHDAGERALIAPSFTEFIEIIAADAEAGELAWSDEWGGVHTVQAG